jgi:8-oxo-dGTP pyrophosphatase MutT (NUDIX family)
MKNLLLKIKLFFLLIPVIFQKKITRTDNKNFQVTALEDGKKYWVSRSVAVDAMVVVYNRTDENYYVLMVKRGKGVSYTGHYSLPCGFMDFFENGIQALTRELWEETNLKLSDLLKLEILSKYIDMPYFVNTEPSAIDNQNVSLYYGLLLIVNSLPEISNVNCEPDEIDEIKWVEIFDELPTLGKIAFNHQKRIEEFCELTNIL